MWEAMDDRITRRWTIAALAGGVASHLLPSTASAQNAAPPAAPNIRTQNALEALRDVTASVRHTGAVGDGRADDTAAIQEIADYFARVGGEWHFPPGIYRTTAPIRINCTKPQRIAGRGKRGVYPGQYILDPTAALAILLPSHPGRAAIEFIGRRDGDGSIELSNIALATTEAGPVPVAAFGWDCTDHFLRDFAFLGCSIHGFTSAFDVYSMGGNNNAVGIFKAERCTINRNRWIARTLGQTRWNGFSFRDNEAGQNGYLPGEGGLSIAAHNAEIVGNCLEGQRNPIKLAGATRSASITDNYLEAVVGVAAIELENIRGPFEIGPNCFIDCDPAKLDHLVLLTNCGPGRVVGPYWPNGVHKTTQPFLGGGVAGDNVLNPRVRSDHHGLLRLDGFGSGSNYTVEPKCTAIAKQRVSVAGRSAAPWSGQPIPIGLHDTANGASINTQIAIDGAIDDWISVCCLFRRSVGLLSGELPELSISLNGIGAPGSRDFVIHDFDQYWRPGEWCLLTAAVRAEVPVKRLSIRFSPFGTKANGSWQTSFLSPLAYVTQSPSDIVPYIDDYTARSVLEPPSVAGFLPGDIIINGAAKKAGQGHFLKLPGGPDNWVFA